MPLTIGLDLGTTSISAIAVDEEGRLAARLTRTHRADLSNRPAGHAEQSPEILWRAACDILRELSRSLSERPTCLGITGQMHGMLLVNDDLAPLTPLITWRDRRSLENSGDRSSPLEQFRAFCDPDEMERTGCTPSAGYLAVTLFTFNQRGELPTGARWALLLGDWVAARLAGTEPHCDRTNAASTGVYDLQRDRWSAMIEATSLPRALFPPVVESGFPLGGLAIDFAEETGLPAGLPISTAIGDHQAALLGSLPAGETSIHVNIGTGGQISLPLSQFIRSADSDTRYLPGGRYLLVGAGLAGGDAYAWLKDCAASWLSAFGVNLDDSQIYAVLNRLLAATPVDCDGLIAEPIFKGTRREPDRRGTFQGVSATNFTPGHLGRAITDGIARTLADFWTMHEQLAGDLGPSERIIATGNAVRENPQLAESLARAFGRPIWSPEHREEAAFGAAILAGVRVGLWPDLETAGHSIRLSQIA